MFQAARGERGQRRPMTPPFYRLHRSHSHPNSDFRGDGRRLADLQRRGLGDIGAELRVELGEVVCEDGCFVAGAGDGDVSKTRIEQVWVDAGIGVHEDALGGEALGAVAGDGVAVVEMAVLGGVEVDLAAGFESG